MAACTASARLRPWTAAATQGLGQRISSRAWGASRIQMATCTRYVDVLQALYMVVIFNHAPMGGLVVQLMCSALPRFEDGLRMG